MLTLGIETSCDETSVAVLKNGRTILSNVVLSSLKEHKPYGGVVPEIASRAHVETILPCLELALKKAKVRIGDIDLIAVTQGPGLMGSLLVGMAAAKSLAFCLKKPLIGVDHVMAHLYSGVLSAPALRFPFLGLVLSGGHTLIVRMEGPSRVRILGRTLDDAVGEAFDKVAKILGLGYPGGPEVDRLAKGQNTDQVFFNRPILSKHSLDFSFSGIKTAVLYKVKELKKKPLTVSVKKRIAAGFQESVCDVIVEKAMQAVRTEGLKSLVVGGGVSANSRLREKLSKAARKEKVRVVFPASALCQDNAAMIAALGTALYREGRRGTLQSVCYSKLQIKGGAYAR